MKDSGIEWIGEIPEDWRISAIKNLFNIISGATPKSDVSEYWDGDIVWITPSDYKTEDVFVCQGKRNISLPGLNSCSTTIIPKHSIIFSKRAPIGLVAINEKELCTNQGCLSCVNVSNQNIKYFYYVMSVCTEQFELIGSGTTFKEISASKFAQFSVPLPLLGTQQAISYYLDKKCAAVDRLMENQRMQIEKLKEYKQSVITEAVTKGIDKTVPLKSSGVEWIGDIPSKWFIGKKMAYYVADSISYGIVKLLEPDDKNGVKVLRCSDVLEGYIEKQNIRTVTQKVSKEYMRTILKAGDIVVNVRGSLGGCAVVPIEMEGFNIAREVALIRLTSKLYNRFVMYYLLSNSFVNYRTRFLAGSVYIGLNIELLSSMPIVIPPLSEQQQIAEYLDKKCAEIDGLISIKQQKIEKLTEYKKSLIYEYVTGKKQVV